MKRIFQSIALVSSCAVSLYVAVRYFPKFQSETVVVGEPIPVLVATATPFLLTAYPTSAAPKTPNVINSWLEEEQWVKPVNLKEWMKDRNDSAPWKPLKVVKVETQNPKPIKDWFPTKRAFQSNSYTIDVSATDFPPITGDNKPIADKAGWKDLNGLVARVEVDVLEARMRSLPREPWVTIKPTTMNPTDNEWNFSQYARGSWMRKDNVLRYNEEVYCPGAGQWRLKLRFRAEVKDFLKDNPPFWAAEKVFWVETQLPYQPNDGIEYPVKLHKNWITHISYSTNPKGPWEPLPVRGQQGSPLLWAKKKPLYLRAEKKHPTERWPTDDQLMPQFEISTRGRTISNLPQFHTFKDKRDYNAAKEIPRIIVLKPEMDIPIAEGGEVINIKATAGNTVTAPIFVRPKRVK